MSDHEDDYSTSSSDSDDDYRNVRAPAKRTAFAPAKHLTVATTISGDPDVEDGEEDESEDDTVVDDNEGEYDYVGGAGEEEEDMGSEAGLSEDESEGESKPMKANVKHSAIARSAAEFMDDSDDEFNDTYFQKLDEAMTKTYIDRYHTECLQVNQEEVSVLSTVVRNDAGKIIDDLHQTMPFITKYEKARIIGQRAKQIESGAKPFVKVPENIVDGYVIAQLEFQAKKIPFIIKRPIGGDGYEYWKVEDLEDIQYV
jgi:DNA-directed RNA polymerase subunit K/omega